MIFLLVIPVVYSYLGETCVNYNCTSETLNSTDDQCVYLSSDYKVSDCSDGLHCEVPVAGQTGYCITTQTYTVYAYPGESCSDIVTCLYGNCTSDECVGYLEGESCSKTQECDVGLSCQDGTCKALIKIGSSGCYNDYDCVNNAGCSTINQDGSGKCIEYFSIAAQSTVDTCYGNKNLLCESGHCTTYGSGYVCLPELKNSKSSPYSCSTGDYCYSTMDNFTGVLLTGKCRCSLDGNSYCSLFPGDIEADDYQQYSRAWVQTQEIHDCHSTRRFDEDCIDQMWDSKKDYYLYYDALVRVYNQIENAESCLVEIFFPYFSDVQNAYEVSAGLIISLASLLVFS